jgi:hypothetical protein
VSHSECYPTDYMYNKLWTAADVKPKNTPVTCSPSFPKAELDTKGGKTGQSLLTPLVFSHAPRRWTIGKRAELF